MNRDQSNINLLDPDDIHRDVEFERMLIAVAEQEGVSVELEPDPEYVEDLGPSLPERRPPPEALNATGPPEPAPISSAVGAAASTPFWVGREFTIDEFKAWWSVQFLGTQPFNAVGYHHTWKPTPGTWAGLPTLRGVYDYYFNERNWRPWGMGPHLFLYAGNGSYKSGVPLVYVGVHPRYDGAGILGRNRRWLHIEHIHDGDAAPFPDALKRLSGQVLKIVCAPNETTKRQIQRQFIFRGVDNPNQPLGIMFHRDVSPQNPPKSCPGNAVTHANLDQDVLRYAEEYQL